MWRAFRAADHVEACGDHVRRLTAARQALVDGHLEEVVGNVDAVWIQFQLHAELLDFTFSCETTS